MQFENEEWESGDNLLHAENLDASNVAGFKLGTEGPDAVYLEVVVGSTTLSFNDLCNIQEGSLIELKNNMLPMVRINVAGETIFEGELVRIQDQLMIQVIKKVD
jgi:flagellar motor switch/type III secretory pathway protein FliN